MADRKEDKDKAKRSGEEEDKVEIDFGAGKISFGGLFKGLGNLIDLAEKLKEEGGVERKGEIHGLPKGARGVYGLSIRTLGGKPVIESFGNVKETAKGPVVEEVREPIVDIFDEKDHILVIAELPGVTEDKIKVEVAGDILNLNASDGDRKYAKEILLPSKVKPSSLKTTYKNGILEIKLEKEK
ncbi:MAG: Hsp20/alpha crystallin family protein [Candidatus Omnitrophica bacterium]|jgi:HSP20 family protein|nr:Hsp20/alpha crystallin family protein [Candidatus Omnitrophota bacterium]